MSDQNQKSSDATKKPTTAIEKDGAAQPTDAELDRVEGGMPPPSASPNQACFGMPALD